MRRRLLLAGGTTAAAWPLAARTQQARKTWRVGILETTSKAQNTVNFDALRKGLRELGYIEGQNLVLEYRWDGGHAERFPELAAELVRLKVDLIVTRGTPAVLAAKSATTTIPVVMAASGEPLGVGVIAGLAHPGGNITGLSASTSEAELKRVELLREIVPGLTRLAALYNMSNPVFAARWEAIKSLRQTTNIEPQLLDVRAAKDLEPSFAAAIRERADALIVGNDGLIQANRRSIIELSARHKLPAIFAFRDIVDEGGLASYSVSYARLYFRAASFVDKIFKGAKPADLPVEQPTTFELVINLKTAKALGLAIPPSILAFADEVIE